MRDIETGDVTELYAFLIFWDVPLYDEALGKKGEVVTQFLTLACL